MVIRNWGLTCWSFDPIMDLSIVRGFVFLGILFIAGLILLLADPNWLRFRLGAENCVLVLKLGRGRRRRRTQVLLGILFCVFCGCLILHGTINKADEEATERGEALLLRAD